MRDKIAEISRLIHNQKYQEKAEQYEKNSLRAFSLAVGIFFWIYGVVLLLIEPQIGFTQVVSFLIICTVGTLSVICSALIEKQLNGKYLKYILFVGGGYSIGVSISAYVVWLICDNASLLVFFTILLSAGITCLHPKWYISFLLCFLTAEVLIYTSACMIWDVEAFDIYYVVDDLIIIIFAVFLNVFHSVEKYRVFELQEQMEKDRDTDALTGLLNRKSLNSIFESCGNSKEMVVLILLDLDHFKAVNDTFGHKMGDLVLTEVGKILKTTFRKDDCIARIGGDEFFIFLPMDEREIHVVSDRISCLLSQTPITIRDAGTEVSVTFSVGACIEKAHEDMALESLLSIADQEMYKSKTGGRNAATILYDGSEEWIDGPQEINESHIIEGSRI